MAKLPQLDADRAVGASGTLDLEPLLALPAAAGAQSGAGAEPADSRGGDEADGKREQRPEEPEADGDADMGSDPDSKASKPRSSAGGRENGRSSGRGRGSGGRRGRGRRGKPAASADEQPATSSQPADDSAAGGAASDALDPGEVRSDGTQGRDAGKGVQAADGAIVIREGGTEDVEMAEADGPTETGSRRAARPPPIAISGANGPLPAARPQPIDSVTGVLKGEHRCAPSTCISGSSSPPLWHSQQHPPVPNHRRRDTMTVCCHVYLAHALSRYVHVQMHGGKTAI